MKLCSIASSSSGNCIYVGSGQTHLLIDAGISGKRIEEGLKQIGLTGDDISAILVTHEHTDHISGLGVMARRYHLPIYATEGTARAVLSNSQVGKIPEGGIHIISSEESFQIGEMQARSFPIYHDAAQPVAYRFYADGKSIAILTDCGTFDEQIISSLKGVQALLLEANHDLHMLDVGKYPYPLKRRIKSDYGHLSNERCASLLRRLLHPSLKYVVLGHLSKENNFPQLAYETVRLEVDLSSEPYTCQDFKLMVADRTNISETIEI